VLLLQGNHSIAQWNQVPIPSNNSLYSIDIHESGLCYAAGIDIIKSEDFGLTWQEIVFTGPLAVYFESVIVNSIEVVNDSVVVAVGIYVFNNQPVIIRTQDNGITWTIEWQGSAGTGYQMRDIEFYDELIGIAVGDSYTLRTTDGGLNWTSTGGTGGDQINEVIFISGSVVIAVGHGRIMRSINGGTSYTSQFNTGKLFKSVAYDPLANKIQAVYVLNSTGDSYSYTSYDGGLTWINQFLTTDDVYCNDVISNDTIYYGYANSFRVSYNNGDDDFYFNNYPFESVYDVTFNMGTGLAVAGMWDESEVYRYTYSSNPSITQIVDFSIEDSICLGATTSHTPTHLTLDSYEWIVNGTTVSTSQILNYSYSLFGLNEIKLVTTHNGVLDTVIKSVNVLGPPTVIPFIFVGNEAVCSGSTYSFTVQNIAGQTGYKVLKNGVPINFFYSSGNNRSYSGGILSGSTTFEIVKWAINECDSVSLTETHIINIEAYVSAGQTFFANDSLLCYGDSTFITVPVTNAGYIYSIYQNTVLVETDTSATGDTLYLNSNSITGPTQLTVKVKSPVANCLTTLSNIELVGVDSVDADFDIGIGYFLVDQSLEINSDATIGSFFEWNVSGTPSILLNENTLYPVIQFDTNGYFNIQLNVESDYLGCKDSMTQTALLFLHPPDSTAKEICWALDVNLPYFVLDKHIDIYGNLIVVGYNNIYPSWPYPRFGAAIQKYDSEGNLLWEWTHDLPASIDNHNSTMFSSVTTDFEGNIYLSGTAHGKKFQYQDTVLFHIIGSDIRKPFVIKLDSSGEFVWWIDGAHSSGGGITDIIYDRNSNHIFFSADEVGGDWIFRSSTFFDGSLYSNKLKIFETDTAGNYLTHYSTSFYAVDEIQPYLSGGTDKSAHISPELFIGTDSILYVLGEYDASGSFGAFSLPGGALNVRSGFVAKLKIIGPGALGWIGATRTSYYTRSSIWWDTPVMSHSMDRNNNIYQSINWTNYYNIDPIISTDTMQTVTGNLGSTVYKYDANMNLIWTKNFEPTYIRDIICSNDSDVYVIGHKLNQYAHFSDTTPVYLLPHNFDNSLFFGSLNAQNGEVEWLDQIGQTFLHFAHPLANNSCGDVYFSGQCRLSMYYTYGDEDFDFSLNGVNYGTFNGSYMFKLTDSICVAGGCTTLCLDPAFVPNPVVSYSDSTVSTGDYNSYQWFFEGDSIIGATDSVYYYPQNGEFTVMVTDLNGCQGSASPPIQCLNLDYSPTPVVFNNSSQVSTDLYSSYQWYLNGIAIVGAISQQFNYTNNGLYSVIVTDSVGCSGEGIADSTCLNPALFLSSNITTSGFDLNAGIGYLSYQWYFNGVPISGATQQIYTYYQDGAYSVLTVDINGCSGFSSNTITILDMEIEDIEMGKLMSVVPNPTQSEIVVYFNFTPTSSSLYLYDVSGKLCLTIVGNWITEKQVQIDLSHLESGIYTLHFEDAKGNNINTKVVKM
jgi:hypothetical protein